MRRLFGTPVTDYLPAFVLWLATAGYLATAYGYTPDSRIMPVLVAWSMLALLALDLASRTQTRLGHAVTRWLNPAAERGPDAAADTVARQVAAVLWLAGFAAALLLIGVLYAVPLYVVASIRLRGRRSYRISLLAAGGMTMVVWLLFAVVLRLQLYPGLLFGGG
jgi:Tripartite tricarboxylate transporter TctB family